MVAVMYCEDGVVFKQFRSMPFRRKEEKKKRLTEKNPKNMIFTNRRKRDDLLTY
jgi:hypothetical protein